MIRWLNESIPGLSGLVALASGLSASAQAPPPRVPPGFVVEKAAGEEQVSFPMFACLDDRGRLYVTESSGGDLYEELTKQVRKCRIKRLEDKDGDGRYETATVFAEGLVPSMGIAWRDGKIYAADPPDLAVYEDANDDGISDRRTVLLTGFGHTDNGSLHGLIFGPDGRLHMTTGHPDGYRIVTKEGPVLEGRSGALFRCHPDGTGLEVVSRGFENLVEIAFTPSGEILGTDNWFQRPEGGIRDAIVHLVDGGLYPYNPDSGTSQPVTGDPLPAASLYPAAALSGLDIAEGGVFPEAIRGRLLSAQHNTRKVQSHFLHRKGSTIRLTDEEFVASDDPDFHPSDVIACPDGSVLVVDTGSWYVHHCPTGKIRESPARGGIWRVRPAAKGEEREAKGDERRARGDLSAEARRAKAEGRGTPMAPEYPARILAASADAAVRRAAADALGRSGGPGDLPIIWEALTRDPIDRFLEHALVHAAHRLAGTDAGLLEKALSHPHPRVRRAALILLNQPLRPGFPPEVVIRHAREGDPELRRTARWILRRHPEWAGHAAELVGEWLAKPPPEGEEREAVQETILAFAGSPEVRNRLVSAVERVVKDEAPPTLPFLLDLIASIPWPELPPSLKDCMLRRLSHPGADVRRSAVRIMLKIGSPAFDDALGRIADDAKEDPALRMEALPAVVARHPAPSVPAFDFLLSRLAPGIEPVVRLSAADVVARCRLTDAQVVRALAAAGNDPLIPPGTVLAAFHAATDSASTDALLDRMRTALGAGWRPDPDSLEKILSRFPPAASERVAAVRAAAKDEERMAKSEGRGATEAVRKRLADAEPLLTGGDPAKGRAVFLGSKVACSGCHRIGAEGGRVGPDLTRIGAIRSGRDLLESILFPSSTFAQGFDPYVVETDDETVVSGVMEDLFADPLVVRGPGGAETRVPRSAIKALRKGTTSIMPEGLDRAITEADFRDLLAYLQGLR